MTKEELVEIRRWWGLHSNTGAVELVGDEERSVISGDIDVLRAISDLISQAHNDVPKLLGEVERLREILGKLLDCADGFAEGEEGAEVWDPFWDAYEEARQLLGRRRE